MTKEKHKQQAMNSLSPKELLEKVKLDRKDLARLRQEAVVGELKNYRQIRQKRQDIARAMTHLTQKLGEE